MQKSPSERGRLQIAAADDATEIFLMDARFNRIAVGLGELDREVPLGLYKVRFRSGSSQHDELVEVAEPGQVVSLEAPHIHFRTAAPIHATRTTHEYQSEPAARVSRLTHAEAGSGGKLFVFAREEDENRRFSVPGVTVYSLDGSQVASIGDGEADTDGRWAAVSLQLDPGTYSVRVATGRLGDYELFATVSRDWQTQVFLVNEDFWANRKAIRAPSLRSASILMSRAGEGFHPDSDTTRLAELARHALDQGRHSMAAKLLDRFLRSKFRDPMLGIVAANVLLQQHRPDHGLLTTVVRNLSRLLGTHPDVEALHLALRDALRRVEALHAPPSLRASWKRIGKASRRRAGLVPADSILARIGDEVVVGGPWLVHQLSDQRARRDEERASVAAAARMIERIVAKDPERLTGVMMAARSGEESLTGLERSLLQAAISQAEGLDLEPEGSDRERSIRTRASRVLTELSAPSYSIAGAVKSLADKMDLS